MEVLAVIFIITTFLLIFSGYPVTWVLAGSSTCFFILGVCLGLIPANTLNIVPNRILGIMSNQTLLAIPYFILLGNILNETGLARELLISMTKLFGKLKGGLGYSVIIVGSLLSASTSVIAATLVSVGSFSLPVMLEHKYSKEYSSGIIIATSTLGQILPPAIVLIILADQIGVSVGKLFKSSIIPGLLLVLFYIIYTFVLTIKEPNSFKTLQNQQSISNTIDKQFLFALLVPLCLIIIILGSILAGFATATEAGAIGVLFTILQTISQKKLTFKKLKTSIEISVKSTTYIMFLLIGATLFSLVFRSFNGDDLLNSFFLNFSDSNKNIVLISCLFVFILGFFIDFFEICFIVIPIFAPIAMEANVDMIWYAVLIAMTMQTSFLTPPFGFSLFYFKDVAKDQISIDTIYKSVIPFILIQIFCLMIIYKYPSIIHLFN